MRSSWGYLVASIGAVCWMAGALQLCLAADPETENLKEQVRKLKDRIDAHERELNELKAQQEALRRQLEGHGSGDPAATAPAPAEQLQGEPQPQTAGGKNWLADHIIVGGYGSMRFEANNVTGDHFIPGGSAKGFTFRRFVLTTDARITNRLRVHTETEFERLFGIEVEKGATATAGGLQLRQGVEGNNGGEISIEQAWGQYNFAENHGLRAGVVLPPLGRFNILHDDDYWDLPRRTLVDRDGPVTPVKTAWRELGAGLVGAFNLGGARRLDYQLYVLNGVTIDSNLESAAQSGRLGSGKVRLEGEFGLSSGAFDGSQSARAVAWRAAFSPTLAGEVASPAITAVTRRTTWASASRSTLWALITNGAGALSSSRARPSTLHSAAPAG